MELRLTDAQTQEVIRRIKTMRLEPTDSDRCRWVSECRTVTAYRVRGTWVVRVGRLPVSQNRGHAIDTALEELHYAAMDFARTNLKAEIKEILGC